MRFLVCLVITGGLCLAAQEPADYSGWMNLGVQQYKAGQHTEAMAAFERAIALDPARPAAHLYLGTVFLQQAAPDPARAIREFNLVLATEPGNRIALGSLAAISLNQKKWDDALGWYEKLIAADPTNADAYYTLGFIAWSKWYPVYSKARADAGLKPADPGPIPDAGVRQTLNTQYGTMLQAGMDALNKALELNPQYDDAMAYMNLLIRERADLRDDEAAWRQEVATADEWVGKALATKKAKALLQQSAGGIAPPPPPLPPPPPAGGAKAGMPTRIRVGGNIMQANLIKRVEPETGIGSGDVLLRVIVGKDGFVNEIAVAQGDPLLARLAMDAVRQWKYRPTLLNGVPVEVETQVALKF